MATKMHIKLINRGEEGELLLINAGKTFISVCPTYIEKDISFNFKW